MKLIHWLIYSIWGARFSYRWVRGHLRPFDGVPTWVIRRFLECAPRPAEVRNIFDEEWMGFINFARAELARR